jgi:predicted Zn-dependent protease
MTAGTSRTAGPEGRFLSQPECVALAKRVAGFAVGGGDTFVSIDSEWSGNVRWARNQISTSGDVRRNAITVQRAIRGALNWVVRINQIDDASLRAAVRRAERQISITDENPLYVFRKYFPETYLSPDIWSDATYALDAEERAETMRSLVESARAAKMLSAGYIRVRANGLGWITTDGASLYYPHTRAQYSVTVRDPKGVGSGWAGVDWYDWKKIDAMKISETALEKCLRSRNPVAVEPGRYTAILEPQAVCDLASPIIGALDRARAETKPNEPFNKAPGLSKITEQVADARVTVSADPMDPELGFPPFGDQAEAFVPAVWIERGILTNLAYGRNYAITQLRSNVALPNSGAFRLSGGTATVDEMIASTKRGLLVTRFSGITVIDRKSLLCSGYTRDGLWLVENGKISKAVKNFRITESPLFELNNIEMMGVPVRCFRPNAPAVCPPLKVRDFSFSSLSDAV